MKNIKNYIFPGITIIIVVLNIWLIINLIDNYYIKNLKNIDLIQKQIWIENNITIWILIINTIFIVILALKYFYFNTSIYEHQKEN